MESGEVRTPWKAVSLDSLVKPKLYSSLELLSTFACVWLLANFELSLVLESVQETLSLDMGSTHQILCALSRVEQRLPWVVNAALLICTKRGGSSLRYGLEELTGVLAWLAHPGDSG